MADDDSRIMFKMIKGGRVPKIIRNTIINQNFLKILYSYPGGSVHRKPLKILYSSLKESLIY